MRRRQNFLGKVASNAARQRTISAEKAVYKALWGSTPEKDRAKTRKSKTFK